MDILIETPDGLCVKQEIWFFSKVLEIKEMIGNTYRIPVSHQTLSFNGVIMEDQLGADDYGLFDNCRLVLHLNLPAPGPEILYDIDPNRTAGSEALPPFPVTIRFPFHRVRLFAVYIDASTAVSTHLRERLRRQFEICTAKRFPPSRTMKLFHGGVEMGEGRCLADYGVGVWSVIEVRPVEEAAGETGVWEKMKVAVALPLPETTGAGSVILDVEIYEDDVVSQLRTETRLATRQWPETMAYFFVFRQAVMKEDRTFRWHGVKSGDVIQIIISGTGHQ